MRTKLALAAMSFVILTGFTSCERKPEPAQYTIPISLLKECPDIVPYSEAQPTSLPKDSTEYMAKLMVQYNECRIDKSGLNKAVKRITTKKEE